MPRPALPQRLTSRLKGGNGSTPPSTSGSRSTSPKPNMGDKNGNLILRVSVLKGRNLAAKDKGGTSDPYLVLILGDAREATSSISKTLNPEWDQKLELPIAGLQNLLLQAVCWDKDRFGKDYMGEFEVPVEDIFANGQTTQEPKWYPLQSKRSGKKDGNVTGEVLLQFSIIDPSNAAATPQQILQKLTTIIGVSTPGLDDEDDDALQQTESGDLEDEDEESPSSDEEEGKEEGKEETAEKKKRRLRLKRLRKKAMRQGYEFMASSDVAGVLFLEVQKITDLPPERNMTRTSFDMDPFVVTSLGRKTYRTRVVRHNLNPVYDEKLVFQVLRHEVNFSIYFAVVDRDKLSGNDFVGTCNLALDKVTAEAPEADPETGLYKLPDIPDGDAPTSEAKRSRFRLPLSRSSSAQSLNRLAKPSLRREESTNSINGAPIMESPLPTPTGSSQQLAVPPATSVPHEGSISSINVDSRTVDDVDLKCYTLPLDLKNKDRWESKHSPAIYIRAKYLPYKALRQQFWRAMLKQYDADDSGLIDKVELTTMLDNLGSTLHESTIDGFFQRFAAGNTSNGDIPCLTFDQAVICLEDQLQRTQQKTLSGQLKGYLAGGQSSTSLSTGKESPGQLTPSVPSGSLTPLNTRSDSSLVPAIQTDQLGKEGEEGAHLENSDLADDKDEEHVIEIRECPICHQPRLNKKSDADIITHIATCASQDWRQVNNIVMAGFVTSSQAQRKWYSKVITKIGYGGYKLGANSANILVQDRITGQINEERMSVYVRLGIRLLYKGLKSRDMEKKRIRKLLKSLSVKQGKKYDDPASVAEIEGFINFHQLDMGEVLLPVSAFKNFNEFFYRALKPNARPCSAPGQPEIITSPADCRTVMFNTLQDAQSIWVKGREFTVEHLLGDAYPEDVARYKNGALGIFRLAPQDYHRFHIPVDGIMNEPKLIDGEYYTVNPMAIRSALDVYGENIRVLVPIDSECHGRVMVVCVGAMMVGSTVITRKAGEKVSRAEELGYFKFGGSTILVLFEPGVMTWDEDLLDNSNSALETLVRAGMSVGHSPDHAPHTEDMRKENPTMEEKQEAKRRIEGSLAPSSGGGGSVSAA